HATPGAAGNRHPPGHPRRGSPALLRGPLRAPAEGAVLQRVRGRPADPGAAAVPAADGGRASDGRGGVARRAPLGLLGNSRLIVTRRGAAVVKEARLEKLAAGLTPVTEGWFVVNVRDAAWVTN